MSNDTVNEGFEESSSEPLFEMAGLRSNRTGLPFYVWISHKADAKHDVRIKVSPSVKYDPENSVVVGLRPEVRVIHGSMTKPDLMLLKRWIEINMDTIMSFWNETIDTEDLLELIKRV